MSRSVASAGRCVNSPLAPLERLALASIPEEDPTMKISIGADHAGFEMKERVRRYLESRGHDVDDQGTHSAESTDYPIYAFRVAEAVRDGRVERGILLCDSGNGIAIAA